MKNEGLKKIWDDILENDILEGFTGKTTTTETGDSDVVFHQFKIGHQHWLKIHQTYGAEENTSTVVLNQDYGDQLRVLYDILKEIYG